MLFRLNQERVNSRRGASTQPGGAARYFTRWADHPDANRIPLETTSFFLEEIIMRSTLIVGTVLLALGVAAAQTTMPSGSTATPSSPTATSSTNTSNPNQ